MKNRNPSALLCCLLLAGIGWAQVPATAGEAPLPVADSASKESKLQTLLTGATFSGRWCMVNEDGELGDFQEDRYRIQSAIHVGDTQWLLNVHMQYGDKDVVLPFPLRILWAGDTPVITVKDLPVPGIGTYNARVVVHDRKYAGTWSGAGYGGLINGAILHPDPTP